MIWLYIGFIPLQFWMWLPVWPLPNSLIPHLGSFSHPIFSSILLNYCLQDDNILFGSPRSWLLFLWNCNCISSHSNCHPLIYFMSQKDFSECKTIKSKFCVRFPLLKTESLVPIVPCAPLPNVIANNKFEILKVPHPAFIASNEWGDEYQKVLIFMAQVHCTTTWVFLYATGDVRLEYALSNFCLHFCHME